MRRLARGVFVPLENNINICVTEKEAVVLHHNHHIRNHCLSLSLSKKKKKKKGREGLGREESGLTATPP